MTNEEFLQEVKKQFMKCEGVLEKRRDLHEREDDRLAQFKKAGMTQDSSAIEALGGMMVQQTTNLYYLIDRQYLRNEKLWDKTITHHINYLLLLKALLVEGRKSDE